MACNSIPQIEAPVTITLKRTQYSIAPKLTRWQRITSRFCEAIALAAIAITVVAVVVSVVVPAMLPIPA